MTNNDNILLAELKEHILQQGYEAFLMWAAGKDEIHKHYCEATGKYADENIDEFISWVTDNYWGDE